MQKVWKYKKWSNEGEFERLSDSVFSADYEYHTPAPSKGVLSKNSGLEDQTHFLKNSFEKLSLFNDRTQVSTEISCSSAIHTWVRLISRWEASAG
jgi:hypothetical protein